MAKRIDKKTQFSPEAVEVLDSWERAEEAWSQAVTDSERAMRYLNNDPYTTDEKAAADRHQKPLLKLNIIQPTISVLLGNEQQNRRRGKIKPRGNPEISAIVQGRWNMTNDEQEVEETLQTVFVDGLAKKVGGWVERKFKMTPDGYLDYSYSHANGFRVKLDPETLTSDYKLKKCRWLIKESWEPLEVITQEYGDRPDYDFEEKQDWWDKYTDFFKRITNSEYSSETDYDRENDTYRVLEMQKRIGRKFVKFYDHSTEEYGKVSAKDWKTLSKDSPNFQKIIETVEDTIHITTIIPFFKNLVVQDDDAKWPAPNFSLFPMWSYEYNIQAIEATCMIDLLEDIQDDINKGKSQARDFVTQLLSGATFISNKEEDAIKQLNETGNQPNQVIPLKNSERKPYRIGPEQMPQEILFNQENSRSYIDEVSLINQAMRGGTGKSGESGNLFAQKVERAAAAVNPYFANLSRLRKALLEDYVDNFGFVYSEADRYIDVKNPETGEFDQVLINVATAGGVLLDVTNPSVYVELDEGEDNITHKEDNFNTMLAMVNVIASYNPQLVDWTALIGAAPIDSAPQMVQFARNALSQQAGDDAVDRAMAEELAAVNSIAAQRGLEAGPAQPQQ